MASKFLLGLLWIGFIGYAFVFAPPDQPDTFTMIQRLSTGQWSDINPWIVGLFNVMGVWPLLYCTVLMADGDRQKLRAWPFAAASMAVGAFAILPYLIFRKPHGDWSETETLGLKVWDWRGWGAIALIGAILCFSFGFTQGNWPDFIHQWQTNRFIHVMSLDFCLLSVLFPIRYAMIWRVGGWGILRYGSLHWFRWLDHVFMCCCDRIWGPKRNLSLWLILNEHLPSRFFKLRPSP